MSDKPSPKYAERHNLWQTVEQAGAEVTKPLTKTQAKALDTKIRVCVGDIVRSWDELNTLMAQAMQGQIHLTLGYKSWTAYVADGATAARNPPIINVASTHCGPKSSAKKPSVMPRRQIQSPVPNRQRAPLTTRQV